MCFILEGMTKEHLDPASWVRPPILHATAALGLSDAEVARRLGIHPVTVNQWAHGIRPIPPVRQVALQLLISRLLTALRAIPNSSEFAERRLDITRAVAVLWLNLSQAELGAVTADVTDAAYTMLDQAEHGTS
jgi:hypothetical protein